MRALDHVGPEVLAQELADLVAEGVAALAEAEVHQPSSSAGPKSASARCSVPRRGSPSSERPRLGPPVVELDVVLEREPVAAVHVQRGRGRLLRGPGREQERHPRQRGRVGFAFVGRPRRFPREQLRAVDRGGDVGEPVRDRLERSDGHPELVALLGVLDAELQRGAGRGRPARRR